MSRREAGVNAVMEALENGPLTLAQLMDAVEPRYHGAIDAAQTAGRIKGRAAWDGEKVTVSYEVTNG